MNKFFAIAAVAAVSLSTAAVASVTFDPETGTGFVGKGDVQLAFGWNNAAAQTNANAVSFSFQSETTYNVTCEWDTVAGRSGNVIHHRVTTPKRTAIASSIASEARKTGQYTGYNLSGATATTVSGSVPTLGGNCPGNNPGTVTAVTELETTGGLFVTFNGTSVQL